MPFPLRYGDQDAKPRAPKRASAIFWVTAAIMIGGAAAVTLRIFDPVIEQDSKNIAVLQDLDRAIHRL